MTHISASQANMYLRCPAQYYFRYVEGLIAPPGAALTKGSAVHKGIEANYKQKIETREDLPVKDVLEITAAAFDERADDTQWKPDEVPGKVKDETIQLAELYRTALAPTIQPLHVEARVEVPLEDGVNLLGYIDLIDDKNVIRDAKTASRTPNVNEAKKSLQLSGYSLAYRTLTGRVETGVCLDYLVQLKTPKVVILEDTRTEEDLLRFKSTMKGVLAGIRAGVFYPNENCFLCSPDWCGYWDECHRLF